MAHGITEISGQDCLFVTLKDRDFVNGFREVTRCPLIALQAVQMMKNSHGV